MAILYRLHGVKWITCVRGQKTFSRYVRNCIVVVFIIITGYTPSYHGVSREGCLEQIPLTKLAIVIHYGHTILRYNHNSYNDRHCGYFTCLYASGINSNGNLTSAIITLYMTCLKCVKLTTARFNKLCKYVATCDGVEAQIHA